MPTEDFNSLGVWVHISIFIREGYVGVEGGHFKIAIRCIEECTNEPAEMHAVAFLTS